MASEFPTLCGKFLVAMPGMQDARFEKSVIYVCAHSEDGAMGFIVNKILEEPSVPDFFDQLDITNDENRLPESLSELTLFSGGPVEPGRGFVLHSSDFQSNSTLKVDDHIGLTATIEILRAIASGKGPKNVLLTLGYSGWSAGQLESELVANGWLTVETDPRLIFDSMNEQKYEKCLSALGIELSSLSGAAGTA